MADHHVQTAASREPELILILYSNYFNFIKEKLREASRMECAVAEFNFEILGNTELCYEVGPPTWI